MKIFITGGAGFIGSNLAKFHIDKKDDVLIFDNLARNGTEKNLIWLKLLAKKNKNFKFVKGDVRNFPLIKKHITGSDVIYHLAGQVAVTSSLVSPLEDFEINAGGTLNVLEAYRTKASKAKFIYASTNKVYGSLDGVKFPKKGINENQNLDFHSPYGCSKGTGDQYVRDYGRVYGLKTIVFRQSCIYGPRQFGNEDQGWVMHFVRKAIVGEKISIYGNGKQIRDLLYVGDLIDAYSLALKKVKAGTGLVYNIGGGRVNSISLLRLIRVLSKKLGKRVDYDFRKTREGDQIIYISDISKVNKDLNWQPKININDGVEKLINWGQEMLK